ncbi:hypothetical protein P153DRAFT_389327 [Dothidotthia symphoricarpi CBS 119687]|uniref:DNA recombination and repair protein Rad51-like C-terminal domain-containing protein n=1 Tax=Dothidotthia symphoricarpi CBS 119687 TaxID=1392245 RepID=A0A6A6A4Q3_9PLEO|nr:uncharacterized protein P153DRAFT_389327 [Dothidotthia symphoricarpi CBS 119687]KAF2125877.1 hypothetical protein P153DRAFT_389327 [Dothidotthia symphoricarpi CBS 119687]
MSASASGSGVDVGAKKLGERLLVEVHVEGLSSVLKSLGEFEVGGRTSNINQPPGNGTFFNIPELDALLPTSSPPTLELISPPSTHHPSGSGKTSLLHLIIAHALLPASIPPSISTGGKNAAVIYFDPLHHLSIPRLAETLLTHLTSQIHSSNTPLTPPQKAHLKSIVQTSLSHLHILRPTSWPSLLSALDTLPTYLFDATNHKSTHRSIHTLILDDIDAFLWPTRNEHTHTPNALAAASAALTSRLTSLASQFACATILASHSTSASALRPAIPTAWPQGVLTTKLGVRRVDVLKFAPGISVEGAEAERQQRWEVVRRGRFSCWRVGREGEGFVFLVGGGVRVERG